MSNRADHIQKCVDTLCEQGCSQVNVFIRALQNGENFPEVAGLNALEREQVLEQLVSIMAVYGDSCDSRR